MTAEKPTTAQSPRSTAVSATARNIADPMRRKRLGAWYTPPGLVQAVVAEVTRPGARSVLDPACGDGRFLAATGLPVQVGVDVDEHAALDHGTLIRDDALTREWGSEQFDAVVGNPPFLNQMATATRRHGPSRFGGGPYAGSAAEFLALAVHLTRPGGRVGMVLPQSLLTARDAAPIRRFVDDRASLRWMWWSHDAVFDAQVRVWAGVWDVHGPDQPAVQPEARAVRRSFGASFAALDTMEMPHTWAGLLAAPGTVAPGGHPAQGASGADGSGTASAGTLGDLAAFTVGFRDQYYGLIPAVGDHAAGPKLITSGLIEPGRVLWGQRPARFAKQRFAAPRVDLSRVDPKVAAWVHRQLRPKVIIANQTATIEAAVDETGQWVAAVPVIAAIPHVAADLERVFHVLGRPTATEWVRYHAAGSGLSSRVVRLSPALLASIPLTP